MILDTLSQSDRYCALNPAFARAFAFLQTGNPGSLAAGRHDIDGDRMFVLVEQMDGKGHTAARLEAHRKYIDIQLTLEGLEEIGWSPLSACRPPAVAYDDTNDIALFDDRPSMWLSVPPGLFAIFFPQDAHAPLGGRGLLKKAIVKVAAG
ncbi:MAG TPA: YhcH/YjgK/YiaL family protein [Vicinamibacterales bacterium]